MLIVTSHTTDKSFEFKVQQEVARARRIHKTPVHNLAEGLAILWEEFEEFKAEVFKKQRNRDPKAILEELVQLGAMCQRVAEDCNLVEI